MGLILEYGHGQTPLDEEETSCLLIPTISTRGELDLFEQQNIEQAVLWYLHRNFKQSQLFSVDFIKNLHKRMYGHVWKWAGEFRQSEKNIGVSWYSIGTELKVLLDDVSYWHQHKTFPPDEIAIRFKHRLVSIHCFSNGNGRHSRLMVDIISEKLFNLPTFSWGAEKLTEAGVARATYIRALQEADRGEYKSLIEFARS